MSIIPCKISYPEKPRITNKPRTSFGPSSGSGIFCHNLIIIGKLEHFVKRDAHRYATEPIYVMVLTPPSVFTRTTIHVRTYHSDPDQLLRAISTQKKTIFGTNTHLENWHRFVQAVKPFDTDVHRREEKLRDSDKT
jgi:hypothetical protein